MSLLPPPPPVELYPNRLEQEDYSYSNSLCDTNNYYSFLNIERNYVDRADEILNSILNDIFLNRNNSVSREVFRNTYTIMSELPPSVLEVLNEENIYQSKFGTLIFDWEKNEDVFSLEIGSNSVGYFIEVDGVDVKQVDEIKFEQGKKGMFLDLMNFLDSNI